MKSIKRQLKEEFLIPQVMVVSRESAMKIYDIINNPPAPTKAMVDLYKEFNKEEM